MLRVIHIASHIRFAGCIAGLGAGLTALLLAAICGSAETPMKAAKRAEELSARARKVHFSSLVVDTHDDTTQRFLDGDFDLAPRNARGCIDIPRMKEGGLGALFFSIWIPSKITGPDAVKHAL